MIGLRVVEINAEQTQLERRRDEFDNNQEYTVKKRNSYRGNY